MDHNGRLGGRGLSDAARADGQGAAGRETKTKAQHKVQGMAGMYGAREGAKR